MFVCPFDAQWCNRPDCRQGICELTGARPSIECIECGAVTERVTSLRLCGNCVFVELRDETKGK